MATQLPHHSHSLTHSLTHAWSVQPPCIQIGVTPLYAASINGHPELTNLLLANKADTNLQDEVTQGEGLEGGDYGARS